jgi:hypothetical protein
MKIANAQLELASSHVAVERREIRESLTMRTGTQRVTMEAQQETGSDTSSLVRLSQAARRKLDTETTQAQAKEKIDDPLKNNPRLSLIRAAVEMLTGRKIRVYDSPLESPAGAAANDYGLTYERHESYFESESTTFSAQGTVRTADGREIDFTLDLSMSRSFYEENYSSLRLGADAKDPLVLNFSGTAAELTDTRFQFDLDADGKLDSIAALKPGSGFLVFDRNQDGKVNNGRELFGTLSGDGFGELAALDEDGNGWIDENDSLYSLLYIWENGAKGQEALKSLQAANVGAISLAHVDTPFSLKNGNNESQGEIRSTGVFLGETGGVGTVQKIDLVV